MVEYKAIGVNMFIIDKYFKVYLKKSLKKYDLNAAEGLVLLVFLKHHNKMTQDAICLKPELVKILNEWNNTLLQGIDKELASLIKSQLDKMVDNIINSDKC